MWRRRFGEGAFVNRLALLMLAALGLGAPAAADPPLFVPVYTRDFPDAFVLPHGGEFLGYATNPARAHVNVQMAVSRNLTDWQELRDGATLHDAMPSLPAWARFGFTWAPEVIQVGDGYNLYFTARERESGKQCIGVATAPDPRGPFISPSPAPLVCQRDLGGTIDASPFRDADGRLYLYFKNDGNSLAARRPVRLYGQPLAADGLSVTGTPTALLDAHGGWEADLVEAPTMVHPPGGYVLFFSAGFYGWPDDVNLSPYAMGYAACRGPLGPCAEAPGDPVLHSFHTREAGCLSGPGHQGVFQLGTRYFLTFHAWAATQDCRRSESSRFLYVAPLAWRDGAPVIGVSLRPASR
jgi:beta-xylosidase